MKSNKKSLKDIKQAHGKEEKFQPNSLEQIWGDVADNRYKTSNAEEYSVWLKGLNKSDLQTHAVKMGVLPIDDKNMLSQRLLREFKRYVGSFRKPSIEQAEEAPVSDKIRNILAEGR